MKPMKNVREPKSIRATEIPIKSEPKAAGDVVLEEGPTIVRVGNGKGRGGVRRTWTIMEQSSNKTLDCGS